MESIQKNKRYQSEKYLKFIRSQPCIISGKQAEPHHVRINSNAGTGRKPDDTYCLPLLRKHHQEWHRKGNGYMEDKYYINIYHTLFWMVKKYIEEQK